MDPIVGGGAKRRTPKKSTGPKRAITRTRSRNTKQQLPKTARIMSKRSKSHERAKASRANSMMTLTDLQFLAKSRGIPFGGLTKTKLIRKINNYY